MDLHDYLNIRACNLSGGNKRKLCCAMTLLLVPKANFLDEPTTGVDPVSRRSLFNLIKHLENSANILTTLRMDEAELLCDNIAVMINGKIEIRDFNWKPLVFTAILLASKFWEDIIWYNIDFVETLGIYPLKAINRMESEFVSLCNYNIYVSAEKYIDYQR